MARRRIIKHFYAIYSGVKYDGGFTILPSFDATGGSVSFSVYSSSPWELSLGQGMNTWVTPSVSSGGAGVVLVTLDVGPNSSVDRKSGTISFNTMNGQDNFDVNCSIEGIPAWITIDGSSATPQTKTISWNDTGVTFIVASEGGWKITKIGSWTGTFSPTGSSTSSAGQNVNLTRLSQNTNSAATNEYSFTLASSADTSLTITVNIIQSVKPNVIFGSPGVAACVSGGDTRLYIPYNDSFGDVDVSANTRVNIISASPSGDYIVMETPIDRPEGVTDIVYTTHAGYSAHSLNNTQTGASAYTYTLSGFTEDGSASGSVTFNYEPYPYVYASSGVVVVNSATTSGTVRGNSNYYFRVIDQKELSTIVIEKPTSYNETLSTNVSPDMTEGDNHKPSAGCNSSANTADVSARFSGSTSWGSGYAYYDFTITGVPQNVQIVNVICTFRAQKRWDESSANYVGFQLCDGTTPLGSETFIHTTAETYYTVSTGPIELSQLSNLKLRISLLYGKIVGFWGASLGISYITEDTPTTNAISAWTQTGGGGGGQQGTYFAYKFMNPVGGLEESYNIVAEAFSGRTRGGGGGGGPRYYYEMLGPNYSANVLTIIRQAAGGPTYSLSAGSQSSTITSAGTTSLSAYFMPDGTNVTQSCVWEITGGSEYGRIESGSNFVNLVGTNTDSEGHGVSIRATYTTSSGSTYRKSFSVTVEGNNYEPVITSGLVVSAQTSYIDHDGQTNIAAYWVTWVDGYETSSVLIPASDVSWSMGSGDEDYCSTSITGNYVTLTGENDTSSNRWVHIYGDYNGDSAGDSVRISGVSVQYYSVIFRVIDGNSASAISYTADSHSSGSTAGTITNWTAGTDFEEDDVIYWTAGTEGYDEETGTYTVTAGTDNVIEITFNNPWHRCLVVEPTGATVASDGTVSFTAWLYRLCGDDSTRSDVTSDSNTTWSVSPSGFGSISDGVFVANNTATTPTSVTITAEYDIFSASAETEIAGAIPPTVLHNLTFEANSYSGTVQYTSSDGRSGTITLQPNGSWTLANLPEGTTVNYTANTLWYAERIDSEYMDDNKTVDIGPSIFGPSLYIFTDNYAGEDDEMYVDVEGNSCTHEAMKGYNSTVHSIDLGYPTASTINFSFEITGSVTNMFSGCQLEIRTGGTPIPYTGSLSSNGGTIVLEAGEINSFAGFEMWFTWD